MNTTVIISSDTDMSHVFRQTPNGDGVWENFRFTLDDKDPSAEWFIAYDETAPGASTRLPKSRRVLVMSEPITIKNYPSNFIEQFGTIVTISPEIQFSGRKIISQLGLPWMYGSSRQNRKNSLGWNELINLDITPKPQLISVVCSTKNLNLNQARRLRFLKMLREELGDRLTIFGIGFSPIDDKADAIKDHKYHLVLENNLIDHGWTEKLADPILGGSYPIIAGGAKLDNYFDPRGYSRIDTTRPREAVRQVCKILEDDSYAAAGDAMMENKKRLMNKHQFFGLFADTVTTLEEESTRQEVDLLQDSFDFKRATKTQWKRIFRIPRPMRKPLRSLYLHCTERN